MKYWSNLKYSARVSVSLSLSMYILQFNKRGVCISVNNTGFKVFLFYYHFHFICNSLTMWRPYLLSLRLWHKQPTIETDWEWNAVCVCELGLFMLLVSHRLIYVARCICHYRRIDRAYLSSAIHIIEPWALLLNAHDSPPPMSFLHSMRCEKLWIATISI